MSSALEFGAEDSGLISHRSPRRFLGPLAAWPRWKLSLLGAAALTIVIVAIALPTALLTRHESKGGSSRPKNIIFMIGDGFGPASLTFARLVADAPLNLDSILVGTVRTFSYTNDITDSAAAATAYSCGKKTSNIAIGVDENNAPCGTLLEAARRAGMRTGLVVTSRITHATPGAFSAHVVERDMEQLIALQQVQGKFDLMLGGGAGMYTNRADGRNLTAEAIQLGYQYINTPQQLLAGPVRLPLIGLFAQSHLTWEIDRNPATQPSLADMTTKALALLSEAAGDKGFFLMVEGSRIDMAAHENDPFGHNGEIQMFDKTVKIVKDWVDAHGDTLMISTADHETGGLTLGVNFRNLSYPEYEWYPAVVRKGMASCEKMTGLLRQAGANITDIYARYAGVTDLSADEIATVTAQLGGENAIRFVCGPISYRAKLGWTTFGHSGVDVNLYAYGEDADELIGNFNNIDVGNYVASKFDFNLQQITATLGGYQTVDPCFPYSARICTPNGTQTPPSPSPQSLAQRRALAAYRHE